ncbi:MAG: manganese-dependent inorganic pyrophosphatase [Phascolarctobacterium sp.]|nr:manganese-dependent inorganic pyrophosphatase [Phascolarctobacterium sp.]
MLKTISKALCVLTLAGLMLWSPLPSAQAANNSFYYISAETDYNANEPIYVVGHKEPDTDTVCSAIAYASLLQALDYDAKAVLPGKLNAETKYALQKFGVPVPDSMDNAQGKQFVLVDHSLYTQSIAGMPQAKVLAVLDHHTMGDIKNANPITYIAKPIGATASIVFYEFEAQKVKISQPVAGLLLSAICSDTIGLKSPTTTDYDRRAVKKLLKLSKVKNLRAYSNELLEAGNVYSSLSPVELAHYDYKAYTVGAKSFAVAQLQSTNPKQLEALEKQFVPFMQENFASFGVNMYFMMLTNLDSFATKLLCFGNDSLATAQKAFGQESDTIILSGAVSRKKQIVPPLQKALQ